MKFFLFLLLYIAVAFPAFASDDLEEPFFLSKNAIAVEKELAPPPAPGSTEAQKDLEKSHELQKIRKPLDCERAVYEEKTKLSRLFGPPYGPLSDKEAEDFSKFFKKIRTDVDYFVAQGKDNWKRPRPFMVDPKIKPCVDKTTSYSYPSGHAAIARVYDLVLTKLDPKREALFRVRGRQVAEDRAMAGVHFISDIEAGYRFGDVVFEKLSKNREFLRELKEQQAQ